MLNVECSYGKKGTVLNEALQENHLNLSLEETWFKKRKTD